MDQEMNGNTTDRRAPGEGDNRPRAIKIRDIWTLPLYVLHARLLETIQPFNSGKVEIQFPNPDYSPPDYRATHEQVTLLGNELDAAIKAVDDWVTHKTNFAYFVQFHDDSGRSKIRALYEHTELISAFCDTNLKIDSTILWKVFDDLQLFEDVHRDYRADPNREANYQSHVDRLDKAHRRSSEHLGEAMRLVARIRKIIELRKPADLSAATVIPLSVFCCYSHQDENLRKELENHLAALRRSGVIGIWHDRMISPGREWRDKIDDALAAAQIILLLISSDFIASDYCFEKEMKVALTKHARGEARVIPIILRSCDWRITPLERLQALPRDSRPISQWTDRDEAFTDVAVGIRNVASELRSIAN